MAEDKSIYEVENSKDLRKMMKGMKVVMIKGVGYFVVSKNTAVTSELLLGLSCSMEDRDIIV